MIERTLLLNNCFSKLFFSKFPIQTTKMANFDQKGIFQLPERNVGACSNVGIMGAYLCHGKVEVPWEKKLVANNESSSITSYMHQPPPAAGLNIPPEKS